MRRSSMLPPRRERGSLWVCEHAPENVEGRGALRRSDLGVCVGASDTPARENVGWRTRGSAILPPRRERGSLWAGEHATENAEGRGALRRSGLGVCVGASDTPAREKVGWRMRRSSILPPRRERGSLWAGEHATEMLRGVGR